MVAIAEDAIWSNVSWFELAGRAVQHLYVLVNWLYMIVALYLLIKTLLTTLSSIYWFNGVVNNFLYNLYTSYGETFAFGIAEVSVNDGMKEYALYISTLVQQQLKMTLCLQSLQIVHLSLHYYKSWLKRMDIWIYM